MINQPTISLRNRFHPSHLINTVSSSLPFTESSSTRAAIIRPCAPELCVICFEEDPSMNSLLEDMRSVAIRSALSASACGGMPTRRSCLSFHLALSGVIKTFQACRALSRYITPRIMVYTENHYGGATFRLGESGLFTSSSAQHLYRTLYDIPCTNQHIQPLMSVRRLTYWLLHISNLVERDRALTVSMPKSTQKEYSGTVSKTWPSVPQISGGVRLKACTRPTFVLSAMRLNSAS